MRYWKWILFLMLWVLPYRPVLAQSIVEDFEKANQAYKQAQYQQAIDGYESILRSGKANGVIYYNLGNSYFKDGQLGKAILSYERARQWIPRDSDLKSNYQYARSFIKNDPKGVEPWLIARLFQRYRDSLTLDELAKINFVLYGSIIIPLIIIIYLRKKDLWWVIAILVVVLIFHRYIFDQKQRSIKGLFVVIQKEDAKFEPIESATTHFILSEGVRARLLEEKGLWCKIERQDGKQGWVLKASLEKI